MLVTTPARKIAGTFAAMLSLVILSACNQSESVAKDELVSPAIGIITEIPDFAAIQDTKAKKKAFFDFIRPIVRSENVKVAKSRERLLNISAALDNGESVSEIDQKWLATITEEYRIDMPTLDDEDAWILLKRRVDTIPFRLALAQSANESSWGTSRFAREGRNFFGEWCFTPGCGVVPKNRSSGMTHEVAVFSSVNESVASYIRGLNRVDVYKPLRLERREIRENGDKPAANELAVGLVGYSERGDAYVDEIRTMIRSNFDLMAGQTS